MIVIIGIQFVGALTLECLSLLQAGSNLLCIQPMELLGRQYLLQLLIVIPGIQSVGAMNLGCLSLSLFREQIELCDHFL